MDHMNVDARISAPAVGTLQPLSTVWVKEAFAIFHFEKIDDVSLVEIVIRCKHLLGHIINGYKWSVFPPDFDDFDAKSDTITFRLFYYDGDSKDFWMYVHLIFLLSRLIKDLSIQIFDLSDDSREKTANMPQFLRSFILPDVSDTTLVSCEFILIEAAEYLPAWVLDSNPVNRVFIKHGNIVFIAPSSVVKKPLADIALKEALSILHNPSEIVNIDFTAVRYSVVEDIIRQRMFNPSLVQEIVETSANVEPGNCDCGLCLNQISRENTSVQESSSDIKTKENATKIIEVKGMRSASEYLLSKTVINKFVESYIIVRCTLPLKLAWLFTNFPSLIHVSLSRLPPDYILIRQISKRSQKEGSMKSTSMSESEKLAHSIFTSSNCLKVSVCLYMSTMQARLLDYFASSTSLKLPLWMLGGSSSRNQDLVVKGEPYSVTTENSTAKQDCHRCFYAHSSPKSATDIKLCRGCARITDRKGDLLSLGLYLAYVGDDKKDLDAFLNPISTSLCLKNMLMKSIHDDIGLARKSIFDEKTNRSFPSFKFSFLTCIAQTDQHVGDLNDVHKARESSKAHCEKTRSPTTLKEKKVQHEIFPCPVIQTREIIDTFKLSSEWLDSDYIKQDFIISKAFKKNRHFKNTMDSVLYYMSVKYEDFRETFLREIVLERSCSDTKLPLYNESQIENLERELLIPTDKEASNGPNTLCTSLNSFLGSSDNFKGGLQNQPTPILPCKDDEHDMMYAKLDSKLLLLSAISAELDHNYDDGWRTVSTSYEVIEQHYKGDENDISDEDYDASDYDDFNQEDLKIFSQIFSKTHQRSSNDAKRLDILNQKTPELFSTLTPELDEEIQSHDILRKTYEPIDNVKAQDKHSDPKHQIEEAVYWNFKKSLEAEAQCSEFSGSGGPTTLLLRELGLSSSIFQ